MQPTTPQKVEPTTPQKFDISSGDKTQGLEAAVNNVADQVHEVVVALALIRGEFMFRVPPADRTAAAGQPERTSMVINLPFMLPKASTVKQMAFVASASFGCALASLVANGYFNPHGCVCSA